LGGMAVPGALPRAILRRPFRPGIASFSGFENLAGLSGLEICVGHARHGNGIDLSGLVICSGLSGLGIAPGMLPHTGDMCCGLVFALKGRWIIAPANGRGFVDLPSECSLKGGCNGAFSTPMYRIAPPLQGSVLGEWPFPGRCPGLFCAGLSGLEIFAPAFQALGIVPGMLPHTGDMCCDLVFALKGRWIIAPADGRGFVDPPSECSLEGGSNGAFSTPMQRIAPPLQGSVLGGWPFPGRCPGLFCAGISGLELHRFRALRISPAFQAWRFALAMHAMGFASTSRAWRYASVFQA
jgi:hypothetical protein